MKRRDFCTQLAALLPSVYLTRLALAADVVAGPAKEPLEAWLRTLTELCADVKRQHLTPIEWQDALDRLYARIELHELLSFMDFDAIIRRMDYPEDHAAWKTVRFPAVEGVPGNALPGRKVFGLRRGTAIIPHGHNNMVSAHLVLRGSFHVRTFHRVRDEAGYLIIEPSLDRRFEAGELLTMSSERDNVHWLVAASDHAYTFDVPVLDLSPGIEYLNVADRYSMLHIDPDGERIDGNRIRARIIDVAEGIEKFGRS